MPRLICAILALVAGATIAAADLNLYVAIGGDDAWSGKPEKANAAKTDGPLQSLPAAQSKVRQLRLASPNEPVNVILRGGTYYLPETLVFGMEDSGTAAAPVTWKAYPGETVLISGGRVLGDLKETKLGNLRAWQATLPQVKSGEWNFRQLFVRKQGEGFLTRRFRPHKGMLVVAGLTFSPQRKTIAHRAAQQDFIFFPGDLQQWPNLSDVEIVALHSWSASRLKIKDLDLNGNVVTLTSVPTFRIGSWYRDERNPYYVENVREELKQPGQWILDRPTGAFTYLPLPDEKLSNATLVAPLLEKLVVLSGPEGPPGDPEKGPFVEYVRFEGLRFGQNEWPVPDAGYDTSQGQPQLPAAIELTGARFCGLEKCVVANTGAYGVSLGVGCEQCYVRGCFLYDLGGGGVKIGDWRMNQQAQPPTLPVGNMVENNLITNVGVMHYSANGIWAGIVRDSKIRHNEVRHGPYTGIAVGWNWSPTPTSAGGNVIEANHVHDVMELVQDGGGIYTLGRQPGNIIARNLIHDNHASLFACDNGQCGLYFDEGSTGFLVEDNIVYDVDWNNSQIAQNRNAATDHDIRTNYLGIKPDDPKFPKDIAAHAGIEKAWAGVAFPVTITPNPVYAMQWPTLPPAPQSFSETFEEVPAGMLPRRWNKSAFAEGADVMVTEDMAAEGKRCLLFTDKPGMAQPFYPYVYRRAEVSRGPVVWEFDFRQGDPGGEASFDLRDYKDKPAGSFCSGLGFVIQPDGKVRAGGEELTQLPAGQWSHIKVTFALGQDAAKEWELSVTLPDGQTKAVKLPFAKPDFVTLTDIYMVSNGTTVASFYVDNVKLQAQE
jgi:hypothetical protein